MLDQITFMCSYLLCLTFEIKYKTCFGIEEKIMFIYTFFVTNNLLWNKLFNHDTISLFCSCEVGINCHLLSTKKFFFWKKLRFFRLLCSWSIYCGAERIIKFIQIKYILNQWSVFQGNLIFSDPSFSTKKQACASAHSFP